jgi:hypothetical protein
VKFFQDIKDIEISFSESILNRPLTPGFVITFPYYIHDDSKDGKTLSKYASWWNDFGAKWSIESLSIAFYDEEESLIAEGYISSWKNNEEREQFEFTCVSEVIEILDESFSMEVRTYSQAFNSTFTLRDLNHIWYDYFCDLWYNKVKITAPFVVLSDGSVNDGHTEFNHLSIPVLVNFTQLTETEKRLSIRNAQLFNSTKRDFIMELSRLLLLKVRYNFGLGCFEYYKDDFPDTRSYVDFLKAIYLNSNKAVEYPDLLDYVCIHDESEHKMIDITSLIYSYIYTELSVIF